MTKVSFFSTIILFLFLLESCSSCDEFVIKEAEVPKTVLEAFRTKYPNVSVTEWEAEKEDGVFFFSAEFESDGKEMDIHISPDGTSVTEEK